MVISLTTPRLGAPFPLVGRATRRVTETASTSALHPPRIPPNWALVSQVNRFEDRDWAGAFAADVGNGVGDGHCDGPETKMPKGDHETQETSPRRGGQKRCPDITDQTHLGTQKTVTANEF